MRVIILNFLNEEAVRGNMQREGQIEPNALDNPMAVYDLNGIEMQCSLCYRGRLHAPADYACSLRTWSKVAKNELSPPLCRSGIEVASKSPPDTLAEDSTADTLSSESKSWMHVHRLVCGWTFRRSRCLRVSAASCCIIFSFEKGAALMK